MESFDTLLNELLRQEQELQFATFTNNTAYEVGTRIIAKALQEGKSIVVDIRRGAERLYYARMNGTGDGNDQWVAWKNNTALHFKHSSYYMHVYLKSIGSGIEAQSLDADEYKAEGGAFPLIVKGEGIVGTITVSGLPGDQDHATIVEALREYLGEQR